MKMKTISLLTAGLIALASSAFGQLTATPIPTGSLASSLQSNPVLLTYLTGNNASFSSGGVLFEHQANFSLGDFIVGNGSEGLFYADVSFLGKDAMPLNNFGVGDLTLWSDYEAPADFSPSYRISAPEYAVADFFFSTDKPGQEGMWKQDDAGTFRTWVSFDSETNFLHVLFGIDDIHKQGVIQDDNDYNDGAFLVSFNLTPAAFDTPVPEPSTWSLMGAAALVGIVYFRRRKTAQLSAA